MASSYLDLYLFDRYQLTGEINTNQKKAMEIELVHPDMHMYRHIHTRVIWPRGQQINTSYRKYTRAKGY